MKADMTKRYTLSDERTGETVDVLLSIDCEALARQLAREALRNKSRKAKLGGGLIVCAVTKKG